MTRHRKKALAALLVSAALVFEQSALAAESELATAQDNTAGAAAGEAAAVNSTGEASQFDAGFGLVVLGVVAVLAVALDGFKDGGNGSSTTTSP